ncbi:MAG: double zinc ribbon domain-containing protein [Gaiellaceae bacterium]
MTSRLILASAFGSVHSALHSTAFTVFENALLALLALFWLGIAFWVCRDARRRVDDPWLVGCATIVALGIPFLGALVYLLFRSPETLDEVRTRDVELRALQAGLESRRDACPVCRTRVEEAFLVCPMCTAQLKQQCRECAAPLDALWQMCPYCSAPVRAPLEPVADDLDAALTAEASVVAAKPKRTPAQRRPRKQRGAAA